MAAKLEEMTIEEYDARLEQYQADPTYWENVLDAINVCDLEVVILPGKALLTHDYRRDDDCQWRHEYGIILLDPALPADERSIEVDFEEIEVELEKHDLPEIGWV